MCVETRPYPKGNMVGWNVVRLDYIVCVGTFRVSPTTKLNVQFVPVALGANAVPGD
jgi:hypothetical protein